MRLSRYLTAALVTASTYCYATDAPIQPLTAITDAATGFAVDKAQRAGYQKVTAKARRLDSRLRLPLCPEQLETFASQPQRILGNSTVGVRCSSGDKPWTLYVGVTTTASREIPVLAASLPRGTIIRASDLRFVDLTLNQGSQQIISDANLIVGMQLRRPATEGATLSHYMLEAPKIVRRGQQILLVKQSGALQVQMSGKAMGNGAAGDRISVKNLSSGKLVEGTINRDGTISVD